MAEFGNASPSERTGCIERIDLELIDASFQRNVFLNCPFDRENRPILQAILFCLVRFGLTPRIATERSDAGEPRVQSTPELLHAIIEWTDQLRSNK